MARTALTPSPIPTPSPILAPEDSPPGADGVDIALAEGDEKGLVVGVAVVDNMEKVEVVVAFGFCVVSVPSTTKSPSPALQQCTEPKSAP